MVGSRASNLFLVCGPWQWPALFGEAAPKQTFEDPLSKRDFLSLKDTRQGNFEPRLHEPWKSETVPGGTVKSLAVFCWLCSRLFFSFQIVNLPAHLQHSLTREALKETP